MPAFRPLALALALTLAATSPARANVFGADHRRASPSTRYPWSTVGRLDMPDGAICTATLVAADLILTGAHCVVDERTGRPLQGRFTFRAGPAGGRDSSASAATPLIAGTNLPLRDRRNDWAFLRLAEPLGRKLGWMDLNTVPLAQLRGRPVLNHAAYSWDFRGAATAWVQTGCSLRGGSLGFLLHDCDSSPGASGSPLFLVTEDGRAHLIAIHAAERRGASRESLRGIPYSDRQANLAVPTDSLAAAVRR